MYSGLLEICLNNLSNLIKMLKIFYYNKNKIILCVTLKMILRVINRNALIIISYFDIYKNLHFLYNCNIQWHDVSKFPYKTDC